MCKCLLSGDGEDALCDVIYVGGCDASHRDAPVVREVNVGILADLEHLTTPRRGSAKKKK